MPKVANEYGQIILKKFLNTFTPETKTTARAKTSVAAYTAGIFFLFC